ncbi:MAG: hypothetical protein OCU12_07870 [Methanophagales archaeon]|nr:hypothetical protein [Methanophagales archaeon]
MAANWPRAAGDTGTLTAWRLRTVTGRPERRAARRAKRAAAAGLRNKATKTNPDGLRRDGRVNPENRPPDWKADQAAARGEGGASDFIPLF